MSSSYLLDDRGVRIDSAKAVINGVTYPIRALSSFSISENRFGADKVIGSVFLLIGIGFITTGQAAAVLIGLGMAALGLFAIVKGKNEYTLNLVTNAGERRALQTKDRDFILSIREALNKAIASPQ